MTATHLGVSSAQLENPLLGLDPCDLELFEVGPQLRGAVPSSVALALPLHGACAERQHNRISSTLTIRVKRRATH